MMPALTAPDEPQTPAARIAKMVAGMAEILGVKASDDRIVGYVKALEDIPSDLLALGIRRAVTTWRYPDMPKPADIRAAVDTARAVQPPAEDERDVPYQRGYVCTNCEDNGWICVAERTDRAAPVMRRCPCYQTNSRLVAPKRYAEEPKR